MSKKLDDKQKGRYIYAVFAAVLIILFITFMAMPVKADATIEYDNGESIVVPSGWVIDIRPEGFNNGPFHATTNPGGVTVFGWPWYNLYLQASGCSDELSLSPSPQCPRLPEARVSEECYYSTPECVEDPDLVVSPWLPLCPN